MKRQCSICFLISFLIACNGSADPGKGNNPLLGKWTIDSIASGKDTNFAAFHSYYQWKKDSSVADLEFSKDKVITFFDNEPDTSLCEFNAKENRLDMKQDGDDNYTFRRISDSMVTLTGRDSTVLYLKKLSH